MNIQIANRLNSTQEYYFSKKLREIEQLNKQGLQIINLGIGSPDLPPPASAIRALVNEAQQPENHGYQNYKGIPSLREAMAEWYLQQYGVSVKPESEILPLMGSKEGIMHTCMTYLQEGDVCLIPNPGYPTYQSAVKLSGATPVPYLLEEKNNWLPDLKELGKQDLTKVKIMWVNYPHMPTGSRPTREFFEELLAFAKEHQILICHDNPYSFILNEDPISLLAFPGAKDVAIELNSLSKTFNMAGWRIGMLLGKEERISEILRFKSNMDSGMFLPMQKAAIEALKVPKSWYEEQNLVYRERQKRVFAILDRLGCSYDKNQTGLFVWGKVPDPLKDGYVLCDEILYKANVFVTPGGIFGSAGSSYIRISLCNEAERIDLALERIEKSKIGV